jgi:hypothetical protein
MGARLVFLAHVSPMHSAKAHIRGTLDYTHQLLQTAAAERAPIKKSAGVARPDRWSKRQFAAWLTQLEEGQYADLVEYFQIDGLTMAHEWRVHLEERVEAAGGTRQQANEIYEAFHELLQRAKKAEAKTRTNTDLQRFKVKSKGFEVQIYE